MFTTFSVKRTAPKQVRACDACRGLKVKCRNPQPNTDRHPCDQCRRARVKCTYRDQAGKRGRPLKKHPVNSSLAVFDKVLDLEPAGKSKASPSSSVSSGSDSQPDQESNDTSTGTSLDQNHQVQVLSHSSEEQAITDNSQVSIINEQTNDPITRTFQGEDVPDQGIHNDPDTWATIHEFFNTMYMVFPVISYIELVSRLIVEPTLETSPELRTLLHALRLGVAAANYRINSQQESEVYALIYEVEASRLSYDFADPPTLDAVVCSLFLFTACNVLRNHNRAFLYLSEASFLLEAFIPTTPADEQRRLRIEKVLFNTESASFPLYAAKGIKRRARKPAIQWECYPLEQNDVESDKVAAHLLRRLTQINLAEDAQDFEDIGVESEDSMRVLFGTKIFEEHRYARIQSADVGITRQWRLSCQLVASRSSQSGVRRNPTKADVEALGIGAMAWLGLLEEGDLRIVGLGKLVGLALNICMLGGRNQFQDSLYGLASVVLREDHEGEFYAALADLTVPTFCIMSPTFHPEGEQSAGDDTQAVWAGFGPERRAIPWPETVAEIEGAEWTGLDSVSNWNDDWMGCMPGKWPTQDGIDLGFENEIIS